ncbi:MAG: outer membrane beta-barrel protein [Chitinophagaceae bacterium]|nr:outer membrane beta-barrel protein [Chitinophagaceae bacterium]
MKRIITLAGLICISLIGFGQRDTVAQLIITTDTAIAPSHDTTHLPNDTIRIGNMIIIKAGTPHGDHRFMRRDNFNNSNVSTNWFVVDLGFNQVNDQTGYPQSIANGYLPAGANEDWFTQKNFKSTNVNIWVFMQQRNLIKHVVNLKYGAGLELNNYKYRENIRFAEKGFPLVAMDNADYQKNKLALDYLTVPLMLNFNFTPKKKNPVGLSAGISAGYLYSSRQKTNGGGKGKQKYRDDFETRNFKIAYIAELTLGPVKLYGSYATQSMFRKGLDMTPFSFGIRLAN